MLKTVSRSNPGWHGTFQRGAFFAPFTAIRIFPPLQPGGKKVMPICGMAFSFHHQILFKGGPQIETEKQTADACPGRKEAKTQVFPCKGSLLCLPQFHDVPDVYPAGLCCGCMDKSHGNHEGRLQPDCSHLHRGSDCHRFGGPADDELLPLRTHGGREPGMAETYLHHLGNLKQPGVYHGLHHSVLCRRQVERLTGISYGRSD